MITLQSLAIQTGRSINYIRNQRGLLILGNGFDMDLQRVITFKGFYNSEYWPRDNDPRCPLDLYLEKSLPSEYWYDLEGALSAYVSQGNTGFERNAELDMPFYRKVVAGMHQYALSKQNIESLAAIKQYKGKQVSQVPLAYHVFETVLLNPLYHICSFNYTELNSLADVVYENNIRDVKKDNNWTKRLEYPHGSLATKDIILGAQDGPTVSGYQLARKTNLIANTQIVEQLRHVNQVVFFGHSLSSVDRCYFDEFFETVKKGECPCRSIIIITKDDGSVLRIKDNLREMYGITWENSIIKYYKTDSYKEQVADNASTQISQLSILKEIETLSLL